MTTWTFHEGPGGAAMPVCELDGGRPGPTWLLTGAVHGDEYEGPEAVRRAAAALAGERFAGRVIALPVANPMAYAAGVRLTPADGGNLNRCFPGDPAGSLTQRWAHWLWERFVTRADRLIDLHAGGAAYDFLPVAGTYVDEDLPLAARFGVTLWRAPETAGVFSREFRARRGPTVGLELGGGGVRDEAMTAQAAEAIAALVRGETGSPGAGGPVYGNVDVLAEANGEWSPAVRIGQEVAAGALLGRIHDWTGRLAAEVVSPTAGMVLAVRRLVSLRAGELAAGIGPRL